MFSRGDQKPYGITYKITPSVSGEGTDVNPASCFQVNGTKDNTVMPQSVLPDLKGFKVKLGKFTFNPCIFRFKLQNVLSFQEKGNSTPDTLTFNKLQACDFS